MNASYFLSEIAYCGPAPVPGALLGEWNFDPVLIALLGVGVVAAWQRGGEGRNRLLGGLTVLFVAFVSPLCALTSALFAARTVHHVLVIAVAAPLVASAWPARRTIGVGTAFVAATVTLWAWHIPAFYTAALSSTAIYWAMQASLLGTAILFWRSLFAAPPATALIAIAATIGQMGMLGALLTFAPDALYPHHFVAPVAWGLTPLGDQQLAGLIMWVPANLPYAVAAWIIARRMWMRQEARG